MRGGKIAKIKVTPLGNITGFDGYYEILLKASKMQSTPSNKNQSQQ